MRKASPTPGSERIGRLLFVTSQAAQALAAERLEPLGLTPRGWGVLSRLAESGPMTQIDLATSLVIDRTAMVYLIDELESAASVERVRNPDDRRSFLIYLTRDGRKLQTRAAAALNGAADRLLTPLAESEREQLRHLLSRVATYWQDQPTIQADAARQ